MFASSELIFSVRLRFGSSWQSGIVTPSSCALFGRGFRRMQQPSQDEQAPLTTQESSRGGLGPVRWRIGRAYFVLVCDVTLSFVALCFVAANASSSVQHALAQDKHGRNQDVTTPSFQRVALKNVLAPERHANVHANFCSCCATATQFRPEKLFSNAE